VHVPDGVRLQKVLAQAGVGSRRACEELIAAGRVDVDGRRVTELGVRIDPKRSVVHVDGVRIQLDESLVYLALNKPLGIISAMSDHFCDDCNRLRLTAIGALHACLGHDDALNLRDLVRAGASDADLVRAIAGVVTGKRVGHAFADAPPTKHMIGIGG